MTGETAGLMTYFDRLEVNTETMSQTNSPDVRFRDITREIQKAVSFSGVREGMVTVQTLHTTAGLIVNENEKGLIETDLPNTLSRLCPEGTYEHDQAERILALGPDEPKNAPDHLRSIVGSLPSVTLIVNNSHIELGEWQAVLFLDFDSESHPARNVVIQVMGVK